MLDRHTGVIAADSRTGCGRTLTLPQQLPRISRGILRRNIRRAAPPHLRVAASRFAGDGSSHDQGEPTGANRANLRWHGLHSCTAPLLSLAGRGSSAALGKPSASLDATLRPGRAEGGRPAGAGRALRVLNGRSAEAAWGRLRPLPASAGRSGPLGRPERPPRMALLMAPRPTARGAVAGAVLIPVRA